MGRHINSLLLAHFLSEILTVTEQQATSLNCGWFFYNEVGHITPVDNFCGWLDELLIHGVSEKLEQGLRSLVRSTPLDGILATALVQQTKDAIEMTKLAWEPEHVRLRSGPHPSDNSAALLRCSLV
ncbi:MAG TPA: hypothetical protein EYG53_13630 [Gammaproteobacteria bacterium]|nr:hypothetical protein [Gammaproteobacteria bacterium]